MRRFSFVRIAIFLFFIFTINFAQEADSSTAVTFPIKVDWLKARYAPVDIFDTKGINLVSPDYISHNNHLWKIKYQGTIQETYVDSSGDFIYFTYKMDNKDFYLPYAISLEDYFKEKRYHNLHETITTLGIENTQTEKTKSSGKKLELIGADIAGQRVALRVSGNITISGQMNNRETSSVASSYQEGKSTDFKIDQTMRFNIEGTIGDRVSILVDQDSERTFDFENNMRIQYTGKEDEIVQSVDAGNITLSLPGTKYVTFSSKNSGLFGIKAQLKFGAIDVTTIASVEKGEKSKLSYEGGSSSEENYIEDWNFEQNKYFFLDSTYRKNFWNGYEENGYLTNGIRVVKDLEVFKSVTTTTANTIKNATAYIDPDDESYKSTYNKNTFFEKLDVNVDYTYNANMGYIRMKSTASDDEVIAVVYRIVRYDDNSVQLEESGDWDADLSDTTITDLKLKMIKGQSMNGSDHPCWDLMWKNVYYLGATNIDSSGFDLQIVYDGESGYEERDTETGKTYLELFNLDLRDANGGEGQDDIIDSGPIINRSTGELWLPYLEPFHYDPDGEEGNPNLSRVALSDSMMYLASRSNKQKQIVADLKYYIQVEYSNTSSVISLGAMVMENSEEITLNGSKLTKGEGYLIDYYSGTLTLLDENATNPDAKLDIKYEKDSFFQLKKKTILGARAQYDFGPEKENFIGATALYYSKSVVDDKVEVGYEPMANFVFDINGSYKKDLNFLTKAVDRLPLVSTDKISSFSVEGEIARVLPNPNTINNPETGDKSGVAYIDDFESSKRTIAPVLTRNYWSRSAVPVEKSDYTNEDYKQNFLMGHFFWYTSFTGISITSVWPDKDVGSNSSDNTISPLYLCFQPQAAPCIGIDNDNSDEIDQAWGGVTYFFTSSYQDQSEVKYLDLWLSNVTGNDVNMHIDLGTISEDQIPDQVLNDEDDEVDNDICEVEEDLGLDETESENETLWISDFNLGNYRELVYNDLELENYLRDPEDPHLDDFIYDGDNTNFDELRTINGTEGNRDDGTTGRIPDTENENTTPALDVVNNYKSITIPLGDDENNYIESRTYKDNGNPTGWILYRIPLADFELDESFDESAFSWEDVEAMRIWFDGASSSLSNSDGVTKIAFAKIEMVKNEWLAMDVVKPGSDDDDLINFTPSSNEREKGNWLKLRDDIFEIEVKNTEENEDYYPPDGVEGEYDKVNEVQQKEQSLVLTIYGPEDNSKGLPPLATVSAEKDLLEQLSMINYKKLKMFVNGVDIEDRSHGEYTDGEKTPLIYFLRFGKGGATPQYYEIRQPVYAAGANETWDERNEINVELDFMTSLKKYNSAEDYVEKNDDGMQEFWIFEDDEYGEIRQYKEVEDGEYTGKEIIIYGTPAISRIYRMETGLINTGKSYIDGEVWLDELRLSDVRKNPGTASRAAFKLGLADLASVNVSMSRKDADFHTVEEQPSSSTSSLNNTKNFSTNASLSLHKFFPTKWGLSLPVTASATQSESKPKYMPGTDILAGDNPPDSIVTHTESYGFNTSYSKKASDYWLTKYTVDQLKVDFHANLSETSNRQTKMNRSVKYSGGLDYGIPFGRNNFVHLLKWTEKLPIIGEKFSETKFYYAPEKLSFSADVAETKTNKDPRLGESTSTHYLSMNHNYNLGYKLTDNLKATYARKMKNNMDAIVDNKWENIKRLNFGTNESLTEAYNFSFSPQILSWFTPQMTYSSNYTYSDPISHTLASIQTLSNSNTLNTSTSLNIAEVFKSFYTKSSAQKSKAGGNRQGSPRKSRGRSRNATTPQKEKETKTKGDHPVLDGIHNVLDKLNTIQVQYSLSNSINSRAREVGTPNFAYRLGFTQDPGLDTIGTEGGYDNSTRRTNLSLKSGLSFTKNITTTFSYANTRSNTLSQNVESRNISQDFFPVGTDGKDGYPFPSWSVRVSGLEKLPFVEKYFSNLSASHSYSGKETVTFKDTAEVSSSYKISFSPLLSLSMKFKNKMSSDFRFSTGKTISNSQTGITISDQNSASFSLSYKHQGGITIPLPFMDKKRLDNTMDFTFSAEYSTSSSKRKTTSTNKFGTTEETSTLSLKPRIAYSFTNKVSGGIFFQYSLTDNISVGERKNMNYGFDVNITIQG